MKFCPHCGKEISSQTKFCSECGKGLDGNSGSSNLTNKFWMTLGCAAGVLIFSLFDWFSLAARGYKLVSFNLFSVLGKLDDSGANYLFRYSSEYDAMKGYLTALLFALLISFLLLAISLVKYQSEKRVKFAYWGFGIAAFVSVIFMLFIIFLNEGIEDSGLTIFPFLTLATSVIAMIFFVERTSAYSPPPSTGSIAKTECKSCQKLYEITRYSCPHCGYSPSKAMGQKCDNCQSHYEANRKSCPKCGFRP